jgi:hypothetical protein
MRVLLCLLIATTTIAFSPAITKQASKTQLSLRRRAFLTSGLVGLMIVPEIASAKGSTFFYDDKIEFVKEESQMPTGGKVDLNSAFVVRLPYCDIAVLLDQRDSL